MITIDDIKNVAKSIHVELTNKELQWALACYEDAQRQDPTGTWNLVVEDLIYQLLNMRSEKVVYDSETDPDNTPGEYSIEITGTGSPRELGSVLQIMADYFRVHEKSLDKLNGKTFSFWEKELLTLNVKK